MRANHLLALVIALSSPTAACAEYHARTILDEPGGRPLGALDVAVGVDDLWAYFDRHPPDGPVKVGDGRTVSPTSIIVTLHVGNPTDARVDFDLTRALVTGRGLDGRPHAFTGYDPQHVVVPVVVEVHRVGVEHVRFDGDVDVASLRTISIALRGVVPGAPAEVRFCFEHEVDDAHVGWRPMSCVAEDGR